MIMQKYNFSQILSRFYDFSIQDGFLEVIALIGEFQGEEWHFFVDEFEEDLVAFPHGQFEKAFLLDPFEITLVAHDLVTGPVGANEEVHMFGFPDVGDEGDDAAVAPFRDGIACFFPHLAQHAVLRALPFLELATHTKPFVVVEVVFLFGAVQHEVLVAAFQIAKRCLFHDFKSKGDLTAAFA